jgi:hypothetical protein
MRFPPAERVSPGRGTGRTSTTGRGDVGPCLPLVLQMLDAGMRKCQKNGTSLTDEQRFTLLTAGQLPFGDWRTPPGTDPKSS